MIVREQTAERINAVVNAPGVYEWLSLPDQGPLDLTVLVRDPNNIVLMDPSGVGGIVFYQWEPGVYEAHTQFLPEARGRGALRVTREAIRYMFLQTDCMELLTRVPVHNKGADFWARAMGASLDFTREKAWATPEGMVDVRFYGLRYADWVRTATGLVEQGEWFHRRLEAQTPRAIPHKDSSHDRYVGACVEMILSGQIAKALTLYNRWARFAGFPICTLLSVSPLLLDIGEGIVLLVKDGDFFVVGE